MNDQNRATLSLTCFLGVALVGLDASGLPEHQTAEDTSDDATVTLVILNETIEGDTRSFCSVSIRIVEDDVAFTSGDTVSIWVYEDDLVGDDEVFYTHFVVDGGDITDGADVVERTFDCSGPLYGDGDPGDHMEFYAEAEVEKAECGTLCWYDRPETSNLETVVVEDDSAEDDDELVAAVALAAGERVERIGRDSDWHRFELAEPAAVEIEAVYLPGAGLLSGVLEHSDGTRVDTFTDVDQGAVVTSEVLPAGEYYVTLFPRTPPDYNFYDLRMTVTPGACATDTTETRDCGNCGTESRDCGADGWEDWGDCLDEGECAPDETATEDCGNCGTVTSTCTAECQWEQGECEDEGACEPGDRETEPCAGGTRERLCADTCEWEQWGACEIEDAGPTDSGATDADQARDGGADSDGTTDADTGPTAAQSTGCDCAASPGRPSAVLSFLWLLLM